MDKDIENIRKLKKAADAINLAVGNEKIPMIVKAFDDSYVSTALIMLLDPSVTFKIGEKTLEKPISKKPCRYFFSLLDLCKWLDAKKGVTDQDVRDVQCYLESIRIKDEGLYSFVKSFITKTLTIGATAKTVNKALGKEAVPEFKCMLANKYFEHQNIIEDKMFTLTLKMDGIRCLCVVENGAPTFYTRQGQIIEGLQELSNEMGQLDSNVVYDGELLIDGGLEMESKVAYKLTTKAVRKDGVKSGITYHVFDIMSIEDFECKSSSAPYAERRARLNRLALSINLLDIKHVEIVPALYRGKDPARILKVLDSVRSMNQEGVMINVDDAPYQFKRTNDLLKVKVMQDCDLEIIGVQEGSGRFKGTLGSLIVDYKGNPVGVGSGLSDEMRTLIWTNPERYVGRIATIQYFEETKDKNGKSSIRFPVFKEIREEGKEVSYS